MSNRGQSARWYAALRSLWAEVRGRVGKVRLLGLCCNDREHCRVIGALLLVCACLAGPAQAPNDSIARDLLRRYLQAHPGPYRSVDGVPADARPDSLGLDSTAALRLAFFSPHIVYRPLPAGGYRRQVLVPYSLEDSLLRNDTLRLRDTLSRQDLRRVLRLSPLDQQGEDPRRWGRWGRSIALISGSLVLTALLFVWRSP